MDWDHAPVHSHRNFQHTNLSFVFIDFLFDYSYVTHHNSQHDNALDEQWRLKLFFIPKNRIILSKFGPIFPNFLPKFNSKNVRNTKSQTNEQRKADSAFATINFCVLEDVGDCTANNDKTD